MQKKILIPLVLIFAVSGVALGINFSNPNDLPDTVEFPRIPMSSGSIGEVIGKILGTNDLGNYTLNGGTGVVQNTQMLSGTTASGYLKNTVCVSSTEVWNGFDSNGKALCAMKSTILAYYGKITEQIGTAKIYRTDGTNIPAAINTELRAGDIIKTDGSSSLTIAFVDTSILRLDADTTASLDISTISTEPNKQIASLILESGQVWGRILSPDTPTSTGYSLGTGDVVAGVRGTSIAIYKGAGVGTSPAWNPTTKRWTIIVPTPSAPTDIAVVHSRLPANTSTGVAILTTRDGTKKIMNPGEKVQYNTTAGILNTLVSPSITSITDFYTSTPWIRENTKKDLDYMKTITLPSVTTRLGSLGASTLVNTILPGEAGNSSPTLDAEKDALCEKNTTGKTYWNTLSGTTYDKCRSELAFADFTKLNTSFLSTSNTSQSYQTISPEPLYMSGLSLETKITGLSGKFGNTSNDDIQPGSGYKIEENGEYISYEVNNFSNIGGLAGKTITLTLSDPVGTFQKTGGGNSSYYILNGGGNIRFLKSATGNYQCAWNPPPTYDCGTNLSVSPDQKTISIKLPTSPLSQLIIGNTNNSNPTYYFPIGTIIKNISIK